MSTTREGTVYACFDYGWDLIDGPEPTVVAVFSSRDDALKCMNDLVDDPYGVTQREQPGVGVDLAGSHENNTEYLMEWRVWVEEWPVLGGGSEIALDARRAGRTIAKKSYED